MLHSRGLEKQYTNDTVYDVQYINDSCAVIQTVYTEHHWFHAPTYTHCKKAMVNTSYITAYNFAISTHTCNVLYVRLSQRYTRSCTKPLSSAVTQ